MRSFCSSPFDIKSSFEIAREGEVASKKGISVSASKAASKEIADDRRSRVSNQASGRHERHALVRLTLGAHSLLSFRGGTTPCRITF